METFERSVTYFVKDFLQTSSVVLKGNILSPERGKLCFEHLETFSDAENNLPLQGAGKTISEVDVL